MVLTRRKGQLWILDRLIALAGLETLFPETVPSYVFWGYEMADLRRVMERTKNRSSMRVEWTKQAQRREEIARRAEAEGHLETARDEYHLASLYFGFAQYTIQEDDNPQKISLHGKCISCYDKVIKYSKYRIEKVEIPYESASIPGLLHLPTNGKKNPCVIFLPGTDMFKEEVPNPKRNIFVDRGLAVLTIDGPGQGESNIRKIRVRDDLWAYEKTVSAAIDCLEKRPEIDSAKIAVFGVSTGSYWAPRSAVYEAGGRNRIKACIGMMFNWEPAFDTEYNRAQPAFKMNYMYMSGVHDEDEFDKKVAAAMTLDGFASKIKCPVLIVGGEYDELCSVEDVQRIFEQISSPKAMVVYANEFHPLGGVTPECWEFCVDWIKDVLGGKPLPRETRINVPQA